MQACPQHTFQILTKRPGRIPLRLPADWGTGYPNCWLGVTAGCKTSLRLMDLLRDVPAIVRFVSAEPLLEDVSQGMNLEGFHWLISGGESGPGPEYIWPGTKWQDEQPKGRRTMRLEWARNLQEKCQETGVVFYFKQVTAFRSGQRADALGRLHHDYPAGPFPWYAENELNADFRKTGNTAATREESDVQLVFELE